MKIEIDENERKFMILALRHLQECHSVPLGRGYHRMAFMLSNKIFGRGYKRGDWKKHMDTIITVKMKELGEKL